MHLGCPFSSNCLWKRPKPSHNRQGPNIWECLSFGEFILQASSENAPQKQHVTRTFLLSRPHMGLGRFTCPCGRSRPYFTGPRRGPPHPDPVRVGSNFHRFTAGRPTSHGWWGGWLRFQSSGSRRPRAVGESPPPPLVPLPSSPLPPLALKLNQAVQRGVGSWSTGIQDSTRQSVEQSAEWNSTQAGRRPVQHGVSVATVQAPLHTGATERT